MRAALAVMAASLLIAGCTPVYVGSKAVGTAGKVVVGTGKTAGRVVF